MQSVGLLNFVLNCLNSDVGLFRSVYKQFSVIDDGNLLNIDEVKSIVHFICTIYT